MPVTLAGTVKAATIGQVGFDTASTVTPAAIVAAKQRGYTFAIRYVRRGVPHDGDLKADEASNILASGLALMAVQYVESEDSWTPSADKGARNAANGVAYAQSIGLPGGINLWCDLEGVSGDCPASEVDAYCRAWYAGVSAAGYVPGLYVGWSPGLNPDQLWRLPFQHYWRSFNLNDDQVPAQRGTQLRQRSARALPGLDPSTYDEDVVTGDAKGGVPLWLSAV
ncbi:MAG TPA: glycoside hydrolase domain-containing protein [Longimicrobiales bacterium]